MVKDNISVHTRTVASTAPILASLFPLLSSSSSSLSSFLLDAANGVGNRGDVSDGRDDVVDDGRVDNVVDEDEANAEVELGIIVGDDEEVADGTEIDQMLASSVVTKLSIT